jgi:outer membrane protein assembly factor BamB
MRHRLYIVFCLVIANPLASIAEDWPMWRKDAGRSGVAESALPESMKLQWVRELPPITPAFHNRRLQFDAGYEPVVAQGQLLVASSLTDTVTSYDASTGQKTWAYRTNGPVRFAPALWNDSVCFGSDDGYVYCVSLQTGKLRWKLRAVPSNRRVLGNRRLISMWPVRGGPVVEDGRVYFAAGVWPFEGVFVYAVEVDSGKVIWRNDRLGYLFGTQPHNTQAIGGLAPQGYLVLNGDELIVPCSTAYPARLNKHTGELIEFEFPSPGRFPGGWFAAIDPAKAKAVRRGQLTFDNVVNRQQHEDKMHQGTGSPGVSRKIVVGNRTLNFDHPPDGVEGTVHSMVAADNRLFVSTREGKVYCFAKAAAGQPSDVPRWTRSDEQLSASRRARQRAQSLVSRASARGGLAIVVGLKDGSLVKSLLLKSDYHVVAIDNEQERVERLRQELTRAGLYGSRSAVIHSELDGLQLPPYIATLLTTESYPFPIRSWKRLLQSLRPFGGIAALGFTRDEVEAARLQDISPGTFVHEPIDNKFIVRRSGRLPGTTDYSGGWTPSTDQLVRFPLGVLWFDDTLAHFKRSPQPRFVGGVMVSQPKNWHAPRKEGDHSVDYPLLPHVLSDIYTGRVMADDEQPELRATLAPYDSTNREPRQYRPPHQKNAWNPEQPIAGTRTNPLTGATEPRAFPKTYGCDGGIDYGNIYTMRSGTPAYYDKTLESGTVFLSGPRSGCTNSIIPSGGLMNVPYFYEGCTCSYPLPTAMALMTMPESHEQWSSWGQSDVKANSIQRIGLNFGAPGDRMTRGGTLWLDYPSVGGPSPTITVTQSPNVPTYQYRHSLWMKGGDGHGWVTASSVEGLKELTLHDLKPGSYTIRLLFAEPNELEVGSRVQHASLQDRVVVSDFDVRAEAGGVMRGVVKEVENVEVDGTLQLKLSAVKGKTLISGIEVVRNE